jgi:YD repeat-containing protein
MYCVYGMDVFCSLATPISEPGSSSSTVIITTTVYDSAGQVLEQVDPKGVVTRYQYDAAGRQVAVINNFNAGVNSGLPSGAHDNQTITYEYTNGLQTKIIARMPSSSDDQETQYIYGTPKGTAGSGTPVESQIATGHLLRETVYPPGQASDTLATRTVSHRQQL